MEELTPFIEKLDQKDQEDFSVILEELKEIAEDPVIELAELKAETELLKTQFTSLDVLLKKLHLQEDSALQDKLAELDATIVLFDAELSTLALEVQEKYPSVKL